MKISEIEIDLSDIALFGNEAGEDEDPEILSDYFVEKRSFRRFLDREARFGIARARKGMGKSTILSKLAHEVSTTTDSLVISVTGSDLLSYGDFSRGDHLLLQNEWKKALSARINYGLGSAIGFAWTDDQMALVEASELAGYKGKNIAGSLLSRIKSKNIKIEIPDLSKEAVAATLERYMTASRKIDVWVFVDDVDATFSADDIQKARVSSFFSACRALARDIDGLYVRSSVRTDVWTSVRYNEDLDKCEQYATDISWTKSELEKITSNKILAYVRRHFPGVDVSELSLDSKKDRESLVRLVFAKKLSWAKRPVSPFVPLVTLGARRPRWMGQLCRLSAEAASLDQRNRIESKHINEVSKEYGRLRVNDIYKEHAHQFSQLQMLIETFTRGEKRFETNELLTRITMSFVGRIGEASVQPIDGDVYKSPLQLAQLLYKSGFILLREEREGDLPPIFTGYHERPEMLTDPTMSYGGLVWEIHPSYRGVLRIF